MAEILRVRVSGGSPSFGKRAERCPVVCFATATWPRSRGGRERFEPGAFGDVSRADVLLNTHHENPARWLERTAAAWSLSTPAKRSTSAPRCLSRKTQTTP